MRVFVVGGSPEAKAPLGVGPDSNDCVIAADFGGRHAMAWGWPVHFLIGDLDSLPAADADALRAKGTKVITAPRAKDETDLELALEQAISFSPDEIVICGALGGRTDHLLAVVLSLSRPDLAGLKVWIADGTQTLLLLRGGCCGSRDALPGRVWIKGQPGDLVSLVPLGQDAVGITTEGLAYPLCDEVLLLGRARGISNVLQQTPAEVRLREGMLLVIHVRQSMG